MELAVALISSVGAAALLLTLVGFASRRLRVVKLLAFPLYVAALAAGLKIFTLFQMSGFEAFDRALSWILILITSIALLRLAGLSFFDAYLHSYRGVRLPALLPTVTMWTAYVITGLLIISLAFPDRDLTPLLASGAVTSLVLGLALQPILGNFFSGIVISLEKPFRIKDWIRVGDTEGRVVAITWRTTHLRTRDNDNLLIPNSKIADQEVLNYFYPHPLHLERIYVGVHYRTPPYRVKQAMLQAAGRVEGVLEKPSPAVYLHSFDESSITYELRAWLEDIAHMPRIANLIRCEIWEEFRRRGITIPFPIRTLEIEPRAATLEIVQAGATEGTPEIAPTARLFVASGPDQGKTLALDDRPVTVGRAPSCSLTLTAPQASKEHFRIEWRKNRYVLTDQGSKFGTFIRDEKVDEWILSDLDRITIGDCVIVFESHAS